MALAGGNGDGVALRQVLLVVGADPQLRRAVEHEPEQQLGVVFDGEPGVGTRADRADRPGPRRAHRLPGRCRLPGTRTRAGATAASAPCGAMVDEPLAAERSCRVHRRRRQFEFVVDEGLVLGWARHLDDLEPGRALQDPVADAGRLQHAVPGLHHERWTLVLVDQPHPAADAIDRLEADPVVMDVVGDRTAGRDRDVRRHEAPSLALREQVAVPHAGPPGVPVVVCGTALERRGNGGHFDRGLVIVGRYAPRGGGPFVVPIEPHSESVAREHRHRRIVGRHDHLEAEAEPVGEEVDGGVEIRAGQEDLDLVAGGVATARSERNRAKVMPMRHFDGAERRRRLLVRHHLARPGDSVEQVAGDLVGLHSSDPATVVLSSRARLDPFAVADLEDALYERRTLLRMLAMRRTMFVVPLDLAAVMDASCTKALVAVERRKLVQMLDGGRHRRRRRRWIDRVRDETMAALRAADGPIPASALTKLVPDLALQLRIAVGKKYEGTVGVSTRMLFLMSTEGDIVRTRPLGTWLSSQYRWTTAEQWIGGLPPIEPEAARAELVRRWLRAFGPGTTDDIAWWTKWTKANVKAALAAVGAVEVTADTGDDDKVARRPPGCSPTTSTTRRSPPPRRMASSPSRSSRRSTRR